MRVFIGSSTEASERDVFRSLGSWLEEFGHEPIPWNSIGAFPLGSQFLARLLEITKQVDAAILIFSEDDELWYREDPVSQPRDNVLLEYGCFASALGARNVIVAREGEPKHPSDLAGIVHLTILPHQQKDARDKLALWLRSIRSRPDKDTLASPLAIQLAYAGLDQRMNSLWRATRVILESLDGKDHPLVRFLEAWYSRIADELQVGGANAFEFDSSYYRSCLAHLNRGKEAIYAVADLSVDVELFWKAALPLDVKVSERVFLLKPEQFFHEDTLHKLLQTLKSHAAVYPVRATHVIADYRDDLPFSNSPGRDMILVEPDLVGGYGQHNDNEQVRLKIERNHHKYHSLREVYTNLQEKAVRVDPSETPDRLREAWMAANEIGIWKDSWNQGRVAERSVDYFYNYDANIRAWVPFYDELIRKSGRVIAEEIEERLGRSHRETVQVLEIGFGTGSLTAEVAAQARVWDQDRIKYYGIDEAEDRMKPAFQRQMTRHWEAEFSRQVAKRWEPNWFTEGKAFADTKWDMPIFIRHAAPFDILAGSLVLHDLVSGSPKKKLVGLLTQCCSYLLPGGMLVFADVFTSSDQVERQSQVELWRETMEKRGLNTVTDGISAARNFLDKNPDMIETVNSLLLEEIAPGCGFSHNLVRVGPEWSPFQVLVMYRDGNRKSQSSVGAGGSVE